MNPTYGILGWLIIGALAGWIGSKIMGTASKQGAIGNVVTGVLGAIVGGFLTQRLFGDSPWNNGPFASFGVALLGACVVIFLWKLVSRRR